MSKEEKTLKSEKGKEEELDLIGKIGFISRTYLSIESELNLLRLLDNADLKNIPTWISNSNNDDDRKLLDESNIDKRKINISKVLSQSQKTSLNRLRRKLIIRAAKRAINAPEFNMDGSVASILRKTISVLKPMNTKDLLPLIRQTDGSWRKFSIKGMRDIDAFQRLHAVSKINYIPYEYSFRSKLFGSRLPIKLAIENKDEIECDLNKLDCIKNIKHIPGSASYHVPNVSKSPYSGNMLKRYIWRDFNSIPPMKQIMADIVGLLPTDMYPIDYVYLSSEYLPQVNSLISNVFWDNIDVSESLRWPDYSIVALYNGVVVGCALMVPDGYISYIVVKEGWGNAGIATFMLTFLSKISSGKDLTLHVSASNNAMILYQKLGFKPEEFIVNFYKTFYRDDNELSRNAFFIRLRV